MQPKNCKLSRYYFILEHCHLRNIANLMKKHFVSTLNSITLQIFLNSYLYQSKLDYLSFPAILKCSMKNVNTQNIFKQSEYDYKLQNKPPNNEIENKSKLSRNHRRTKTNVFFKDCLQQHQ